MRRVWTILLMLLWAAVAKADECQLPEVFAWRNEAGSVATFEVSSAGALRGTYRTALGCRAGEPQPLAGWCNGYGLTFTVDFRGCGSTTAWAATLVETEDGPRIEALWHLVRAGDAPSWDAIIAGRSTFRPDPKSDTEAEDPAVDSPD